MSGAKPIDAAQPSRVGFPWYDVGSARVGWDALWRALSPYLIELGYGPLDEAFDRRPGRDQWHDRRLLISQCCGLDVVGQASHLEPIAAPVFGHLDCEPGDYYSLVVARETPDQSVSVAINDRHSRSGHTALRHWLSDTERRAIEAVCTGSHANSIAAVLAGQVDLAAIDAISWRALHTPDLVIIGRTPVAPAPPFITAPDLASDPLREALAAAIDDCGNRSPLGLCGIVPCDRDRYETLREDLTLIENGWPG